MHFLKTPVTPTWHDPTEVLPVIAVGEIQLEAKSTPNPEILSTEAAEKASTLVREETLSQNVMHIPGDLL